MTSLTPLLHVRGRSKPVGVHHFSESAFYTIKVPKRTRYVWPGNAVSSSILIHSSFQCSSSVVAHPSRDRVSVQDSSIIASRSACEPSRILSSFAYLAAILGRP